MTDTTVELDIMTFNTFDALIVNFSSLAKISKRYFVTYEKVKD